MHTVRAKVEINLVAFLKGPPNSTSRDYLKNRIEKLEVYKDHSNEYVLIFKEDPKLVECTPWKDSPYEKNFWEWITKYLDNIEESHTSHNHTRRIER